MLKSLAMTKTLVINRLIRFNLEATRSQRTGMKDQNDLQPDGEDRCGDAPQEGLRRRAA